MRYFITDHLGSVRAVVNADGEVVEQNDYMPYGTLHANSALQKTDNRYLYGGKELQTDFGVNYYDSFARFQRTDGAFNSIDPLAEKLYGASPYAYCFGNPIVLQDPNGKLPIIPILWVLYEVGSTIYDGYTTYQTLSDENATTFDKATALGGVLASAVLPGGGYTTVSKVDDVIRIAKTTDKIADGAKTYRSFTKSNFRENLVRRTGINPTGKEAHHILPQKFIDHFQQAGIDIHDPQHGIWLDKANHSKKSYEYNQEWDKFFEKVTNPTKEQIYEKAKQLMTKVYGTNIE